MIFKEIERNLFTMPPNYHLVHCISSDASMHKGIADIMKRKFRLIQLREMKLYIGRCYKVNRVFNLVTKDKYYSKPTYTSMKRSLESLREQCIELNISKLAMPTIGCGLDKLEWDKVKEIIEELFKEIDIEIVVCHYDT